MTAAQKTAAVHRLAAELGFDRVGIARAAPLPRASYLRQWLDAGRAGRMDFLRRQLDQRTDPRMMLPRARTVIVVALNYHQPAPPRPEDRPRGRVAMYAWGDDYHGVVRDRLRRMVEGMREVFDECFEARICVDTAPLVEREWAAAAGVGWIGKNTLVLHPGLGSFFFLGEIVTTLELRPDSPATDHCGTCTRCLEACPTRALFAPYQMDASRCISYFTIELREDIPTEFHRQTGDWVFGCDLCQQVCPHNRRAPTSTVFTIQPPSPFPALDEMIGWAADQYRAVLGNSAIKRAKLPMLRRNAAIARANAGEG